MGGIILRGLWSRPFCRYDSGAVEASHKLRHLVIRVLTLPASVALLLWNQRNQRLRVSKGHRNRQGLSWESEWFIVLTEGEGQQNLARGRGPYFVHVSDEWRIRGLPSCYQPHSRSGHYRGTCLGWSSLNPARWIWAHAS